MKVIGVDPGSRACGYGIVESTNGRMRHLTSGTIKPPGDYSLAKRLESIYSGITEVIEQHSPTCMSLEQVFFAKNASSAIKLGQARGIALLAASSRGIDIYEYAPANIKLALTGNGRAGKLEVQKMVSYILGIKDEMDTDRSDAIAIAICHLNNTGKPGLKGIDPHSTKGRRKRRRFTLDDISSTGKSD